MVIPQILKSANAHFLSTVNLLGSSLEAVMKENNTVVTTILMAQIQEAKKWTNMEEIVANPYLPC